MMQFANLILALLMALFGSVTEWANDWTTTEAVFKQADEMLKPVVEARKIA